MICKIFLILIFGAAAEAAILPPLHKAAAAGDLDKVKELVASGESIFLLEPDMGTSVLHKAVIANNPRLVAFLIDEGAFLDLQSPTNNLTPLHDAVLYQKPQSVEVLLDKGANTKLKNVWGLTAEDYAKSNDHAGILALFKKHKRKSTVPFHVALLHDAIKQDDLNKVKNLIRKGTPVSARNEDGNTPLLESARYQRHEIAAFLLAQGADANSTGLTMRANSGHKAAFRGDAAMLEILIRNGRLNLDAQGPYNGYTVLHDALWFGHEEAAMVALENGANPYLKTHFEQDALDLAKIHNLKKVISFIQNKRSPK